MTGRELEMASYHIALPTFDGLSVQTKSMLGALLDYANVDRQRFANAWKSTSGATIASAQAMTEQVEKDALEQPNLFGNDVRPPGT